MTTQTISILGCGWYGLAMAKALIFSGYHINGSTTHEDKLETLAKFNIKPYLINFDGENTNYDEAFFNCDILIISIPPKRNAHADYPTKINNIATVAERLNVKQVIFISSTGIFEDGNFIVNEDIIPQPNTAVGIVLQEAENILRQNKSFQTTIIRFAGLIGPNRNLAKHFAGKKGIANGLAPINLIHLYDCIGLTKAILQKRAFGLIYHGVAPNHPTRAAFYTQACIDSGFERPEFINELLDWKQIESVVVNTVLKYKWKISFSVERKA